MKNLTLFLLSSLAFACSLSAQFNLWNEKRNYDWDSQQSNWTPHSRNFATRNSALNLTEEIIQNYDGSTYQDSLRFLYLYPQANGPWTELISQADSAGVWVNTGKTELQYDSQGYLTQRIVLTWAGIDWDTTTGIQYDYTFNSNNQVARVVVKNYQTGQGWLLSSRNTQTYNSNNERDTLLYETYDQGNFLPTFRSTYPSWHNFSQAQANEVKSELYVNGAFQNFRKQIFTYLPNNITDEINLLWNANSWDTTGLNRNGEDTFGNTILLENYDYTGGNYPFRSGLKWNYTFANPQTLSEIIEQACGMDSIYKNTFRQEFFYPPVGVEEISAELPTFSLYPNPFSDQLNLQYKARRSSQLLLEVFDQKGKRLWTDTWNQQPGNVHHPLSLPLLSPGIYLVKLMVEGRFYTQKLIKK